jgi:hypothetical protein
MLQLHVIRYAFLALIALACILPSAQAQSEYKFDWGKSLMEDFGFDDMAEQVFTGLSKESSKDRKNEGLLGLSSLQRRLARRADDIAARAKLNDESLKLLEQVAKNLGKSSQRYWDTQFELADTLEEVVAEDIDLIRAGRVPADALEDIRKRNANRLDRAAFVYEQAASEFGDVSIDDDQAGWVLGQKSRLMGIILDLRRSELIATDPKMVNSPSREASLRDMQAKLEDYALDNDSTNFGMYGYYYLARVKEELHGIRERVPAGDVISGFQSVPNLMITTPDEFTPTDDYPEWLPLNASQQWIVQRSYLSLLQFTNRKGLTEKTVAFGRDMQKKWEACGYSYNVLGNLARVELAKALQNSGESSAALNIVANISDIGGFEGREADKLMSVIIRTAEDTSRFEPVELAAGANGAYLAGRKDEAKYYEAIELYQGVLANLDKVADEAERNEMGRIAGYRMGVMLDRLGRDLEAAVALEQTYRRFNNDKVVEDEKLNNKVQKYWLAVLKEFRNSSGGSEFAKELVSKAEAYIIANPPKGGFGTTLGLQWSKAENQRRQKNYDAALKNYEQLAAKASEYQERAMVRINEVSALKLSKNKDATAADWMEVVKAFQQYKDFTKTNEVNEPKQVEARKTALRDSDIQIVSALTKAARATKADSEAKPIHEQIVALADGFDARTKDSEARSFVRYSRIRSLVELGRLDDAEAEFNTLMANNPTYRSAPVAAQVVGLALRERYKTMPSGTDEEQAKRKDMALRAGNALKSWILQKPQKKSAYYSLVYRLFYDVEEWDDAYAVLKVAYDRFAGKPKHEKAVGFFRRAMARCQLGKAEEAYANDDLETASKLFSEAALIYQEIVGDPPKGSASLLEEAALTIGGFVTKPDRRGRIKFFQPENVNFEKAQELWVKVERYLKKKVGKTTEEQRNFDDKRKQARFYIFLMDYQLAKADNDNRRRERLRKNLDFKFKKENGEPGGPRWAPKYKWLFGEVRRSF